MLRLVTILLGLALFSTQASAQYSAQNAAVPRSMDGFNGLPLNLGTGALTAGSVVAPIINKWTAQYGAIDPTSWSAALVSAGTGNTTGDQLTLNDGCATHAVVVVTQTGFTGGGWYVARRGACAVAPSTPISVLSTTGTGTGAQFNLAYAPIPSDYSIITSGNGIGNSFSGGAVPNVGLYGQEDYFAGGLAGGGFIGNSGGNAIVGLGAGFGNGQTFTGSNNWFGGNDAGRDIYAPTGQSVSGNTVTGTTALRDLGSVAGGVASGIVGVTAYGGSAMGYVTVVGGPANDTAIGAGSCSGSSTGNSGANVTMGQSACFGANSGTNFTYINAYLILGTNIGNTALNDQDVILIGTGYTSVEPPTITTNDYLNFNNIWTSTSINVPGSASQVFSGDVTAGGGGTALTTTATNGFTHPAFSNGTPTGTPAVATPACEWNQTSHSLNCHDTGGWYHLAFTAGGG